MHTIITLLFASAAICGAAHDVIDQSSLLQLKQFAAQNETQMKVSFPSNFKRGAQYFVECGALRGKQCVDGHIYFCNVAGGGRILEECGTKGCTRATTSCNKAKPKVMCTDDDWRSSGGYCIDGHIYYCAYSAAEGRLFTDCGSSGCAKDPTWKRGYSTADICNKPKDILEVQCNVEWHGPGNYCVDGHVYECRYKAGMSPYALVEDCGGGGCTATPTGVDAVCNHVVY